MSKYDTVPDIVDTIKELDRNVILAILHDVHEYLDTTEAPRSGHQQEHEELSKEIDTFGETEHGKKLLDHMQTLKERLGIKARSMLALVKKTDMKEAMEDHEDHEVHSDAMKQMLGFAEKRKHITKSEKGRQKEKTVKEEQVKKAKKLAAKKLGDVAAKKAKKPAAKKAKKPAAKKAKKPAAKKAKKPAAKKPAVKKPAAKKAKKAKKPAAK
jgi:hypothetical protein